jgi:O-antigen/teichoic acid export membrane protein
MAGNSFLSNFSFTFVLNLAVKLFWVLGIEVTVQNILGTTVYGAYFELFQFTYLFFIILDLGLSNYNSRVLAGDATRLKELFSSMLTIKMGLSIVYLLVLFFASLLVGYSYEKRAMVMFIGINQVLLSLMLYLRSNVSALHFFRADALLSVLDRFIMGLLCAGLIWLPFFRDHFSLYTFLFVQLIGYLSAVSVALAVVMRRGVKISFRWDGRTFTDILKKSYPFAILFTLMSLYTRIDAVMLGRLLPDGEFHAGVYASAFRLLDACIIFAVLLSNLLLPMFSRMISRKEKVDGLVRESYQIVLIAATILPFAFYFYSKPFYTFLYHENPEYGSEVFGLLFFNFIPMAFGYIFGTLLTAGNRLFVLNGISIAGLALNVLLNLLLIPAMQAKGATIATLITQSFVTLSAAVFSVRYFRLRVQDFLNARMLMYLFATAASFFLFSRYVPDWLPGVALSVLASLAFAWVFRLVRPEEIRSLFRPKA